MKVRKGILILSPFFSPNTGGVETHLDDLCAVLGEKNIEATVITYQPLTSKALGKSREERGPVKIIRIRWYGFNLFHKLEKYPLIELIYLFPGIFFRAFFFLLRHHKKIGVIHSHGIVASLIARVLGVVFKKRIVASTHAIYHLEQRPGLAAVVKRLFFSFDGVLTLSEQSKRELIKAGVSENKIAVYRYWVDQETFRPLDKTACKRELGWQDKFIVLFVGRLLEIKGVKLLLEAAQLLGGESAIAIIGDGPLEGLVKQTADSVNRIIYPGKIANDKLSIYYNASDVVIVPSIYEEGFGRIILEALSCGIPVIASRRGGIVEALTPEVGLLIEPTAQNIADTIEKLHQDGKKREELATNAREYALERFGKANAELIVNSYGLSA